MTVTVASYAIDHLPLPVRTMDLPVVLWYHFRKVCNLQAYDRLHRQSYNHLALLPWRPVFCSVFAWLCLLADTRGNCQTPSLVWLKQRKFLLAILQKETENLK